MAIHSDHAKRSRHDPELTRAIASALAAVITETIAGIDHDMHRN